MLFLSSEDGLRFFTRDSGMFLFHLSSMVKKEMKSFYHPFLQWFVLVEMEACFLTPCADAK